MFNVKLTIMSKVSFAEQVNNAQVMSIGLKSNIAQLYHRGITDQFVGNLEADIAETVKLNSEQEKLKADLKTKTSELNTKLAEVSKKVAEAKKLVKLELPQSRWKEFGINNKV
jgi:hypothetical protein